MHLSELKALHISKLVEMAEALEIENVSRMRKQELMFAIMKKRAKAGEQVFGDLAVSFRIGIRQLPQPLAVGAGQSDRRLAGLVGSGRHLPGLWMSLGRGRTTGVARVMSCLELSPPLKPIAADAENQPMPRGRGTT